MYSVSRKNCEKTAAARSSPLTLDDVKVLSGKAPYSEVVPNVDEGFTQADMKDPQRAQAVIKVLGLHGADRRAMVHSEEELKMLVTASQEAGVLEEDEEQMLHRVFGFADLTAGQIMMPRTEIVAVAADTPREVLIDQIAKGDHTRLPVYRANLDDEHDWILGLDTGIQPVMATEFLMSW